MHFWHETVIHGSGVGHFKIGGIDDQTIKSLEKMNIHEQTFRFIFISIIFSTQYTIWNDKTKFSYRFKTVNILQSKTYMLDHNSSIMCRTTVQYITFPDEITRTYYQIII